MYYINTFYNIYIILFKNILICKILHFSISRKLGLYLDLNVCVTGEVIFQVLSSLTFLLGLFILVALSIAYTGFEHVINLEIGLFLVCRGCFLFWSLSIEKS